MNPDRAIGRDSSCRRWLPEPAPARPTASSPWPSSPRGARRDRTPVPPARLPAVSFDLLLGGRASLRHGGRLPRAGEACQFQPDEHRAVLPVVGRRSGLGGGASKASSRRRAHRSVSPTAWSGHCVRARRFSNADGPRAPSPRARARAEAIASRALRGVVDSGADPRHGTPQARSTAAEEPGVRRPAVRDDERGIPP